MSTGPATHRLLPAAGFLAAVAVLLWCMAGLSGWISRGQLIHEAGQDAAAIRSGNARWQWPLRQPSDLVAQRVFGAASLATQPQGLAVRSRDGSAFELGLPLASPVDLAHWPLLTLHGGTDHAGSLALGYQSEATAPACWAEHAASLSPEEHRWSIDLAALEWRDSAGARCPPPGAVAYLLRLRVTLPADASLSLQSAALTSRMPMPELREGAAPDIQLPANQAAANWAPTPQQLARYPAPVVGLPRAASSEAMLLWRDRIHRYWPAAVVLPQGERVPASTAASMPAWLDTGVCALYLAWLVWLALRQRPGLIRPWTEVAAIAAGPLWLIAGLRWGPTPSLAGITAFVAALVYGGQSEWRRRPLEWGWLGQRVSDWLIPWLPFPVAAMLTLADGHRLLPVDGGHVLAYVGWALLQQWAMLALVMGRLERTGLPRPAILLVTAGLFGLLHTPNGALMQLCVMAELWWAWSFMRAPRLLPVALAHAASALLVESGLTGHLVRSLEVSARFFL